MMKARQYDRRIFTREIKPHIYAIQESNTVNRHQLQYFGAGMNDFEKNTALSESEGLLDTLTDAKEYGSILNVDNYNWDLLYRFAENVDIEGQMSLDSMGLDGTQELLFQIIGIGQAMAQKYDVVVTNPPYMGGSGMSSKLSKFVKDYYPDSKSDLFAVFIERCREMAKENGYQAMITQHAWMFLSSFEKLRTKLLTVDTINMAHLGARAFEEIGGEVVQTTSFVLRKSHLREYKGTYCRLIDPTTQQGKENMFLLGKNRYVAQQDRYSKIPCAPVAYWLSDEVLKCYDNPLISTVAFSDGQILTGNNEKYLRNIWEVNATDVQAKKWVLHAKGGEFRRWYGNIDTVVRFDSITINHYRTDPIARFPKDEILFRRGITWTLVSMNPNFGVRELSADLTFNKAAATILFNDESIINYVLGFLNSKVAQALLRVINPTINNNIKDVLNMPYVMDLEKRGEVENLVCDCISASKEDWDSFETSWNFKKHPLV
jgi:hypothetical protein